MHSLHSFAHDGMHIDPGVEEQTQEQPLIEEPEDPEPYPQQEDLRQPPTPLPMTPTLARKVWSSSFVPVWVEELVTIRSEPSHDLAMG
ncbi:hypothetical protein U9M48_035836 [Paspalum notatum var. saurae]|uniref:Uncharacterized protein n=1 Tax=Paspalum notatum var. saurae TaxID=547442 RepID=A0AAQ3UHU0_PASNO